MEPTHSLLKRQLKRHFGDGFRVPAEWRDFVGAVGAAYREFDDDREMLERSLDLSSQELLHANSELRAVFQAIPDLLFRLDHDGTILDFKAGATNDLLFQRQQLFGKKIQKIPVEPIGNQFQEAIDRVLAEKSLVRFEYALTLQGQESSYEARLVPLAENQIVAIIRNITERKKADAVRFEQNQILEMIASGRPLSDTLTRLVHLTESQSEGMLCSILILDPDGQRLRHGAAPGLPEAYNRAIDGVRIGPQVGSCGTAAFLGKPVIVADILEDPLWADFRELAAQYGLRACWSIPVFSHKNKVLGTFAMYYRDARTPSRKEQRLIDIAAQIAGIALERQQAEEELRRTVSLLQSTLESTADGLLVVDGAGRIVLFNEHFVTLWRIPQNVLDARNDELALAHVLDQVKEPEPFLRKVRELYASPDAESFDELEFKDGRVFERYSCPQRLDGVPVGRVWSFRDVTARKHLEEQFRQTRKMEAFGQLAAGVAHDFNNILTIICGNLTLLRESLPAKSDGLSCVDQAISAADRAANLTRQLLTFSRRQPLQPRDLDLNEVVANMTKMLKRLIGEHIALEAHYAPGNAPIHADPGMMEQVLINLAVNSRDAMPKGGRLILQTAAVTLTEADARNRSKARPGEFIELTVNDTGSGISRQDLPHIFEPFFTTKEVGKGTGLGLATVFGIIDQHQGWIEVESDTELGTTFHMFLPRLSQAAAAALLESSAAPAARGGTETILLVEDEAAVRQLMHVLLAGHGYHVHEAASGVAAFDVWAQHRERINLLVTDMVMPEGIGGRELAERLTQEKPGLKVIYCSGYTDDALGSDSPLRNNKHFLEKPFDPNSFLQRVRQCLDGA
jgi:PAS domain S-box-containing protein